MLELITPMWRPATKSKNTLLAAGYSQKQLNDIGKVFVERNCGKEIDGASSLYSAMVRSSGSAHNIKPPKIDPPKTVEIKSDEKIESDTKQAQEVKSQTTKMSKHEAIAWYDGNRLE